MPRPDGPIDNNFYVRRADGLMDRSRYFVLAYDTDPYATAALRAYAEAARSEYPVLATQLFNIAVDVEQDRADKAAKPYKKIASFCCCSYNQETYMLCANCQRGLHEQCIDKGGDITK